MTCSISSSSCFRLVVAVSCAVACKQPPTDPVDAEAGVPEVSTDDADGGGGDVELPEAYLETFDARGPCDLWGDRRGDGGDVGDPPADMRLLWTFFPFEDPDFMGSRYVGHAEADGPLALREDGGVCLSLGDRTAFGCLSADGDFLWVINPRGEAELAGGPAILPDGRVAAAYTDGSFVLVHPDGEGHGLGGIVPAGVLAYSGGPSMADSSRLAVVSSGRLFTLDRSLWGGNLALLDRCLWRHWYWHSLGTWQLGNDGCSVGDSLVLAILPFGGGAVRLVRVGPEGNVATVLEPYAGTGLRVLDHGTYAYWTEMDEARIEWCVGSLEGGEPECAELQGAVPPMGFLIGKRGEVIGFGNRVAATDEWEPRVGVWRSDGSQAWMTELQSRPGLGGDVAPPAAGENGQVVVLTNCRGGCAGTDPAAPAVAVLVFDQDGVLGQMLPIEGIGMMRESSPLLSQDGRLYFVAAKRDGDGWDRNGVAVVQTSVAGLDPDGPGWGVYDRRTVRGDLWLP